MTQRTYISTIIGDGLTPDTAFRAAWWDILSPPYPARVAQNFDSVRYKFWVGILDTDDTQHAALIADNRIRYIPQALLATTIGNLTAAQKTSVLEVYTWLGFPTDIWSNNARVADVLFYISGRASWKAVPQAADA